MIASDDPTEKAAGRGPGILRDGGVEVEWAEGAEAAAARLLNQPFRKHARTGPAAGRPQVGADARRPHRHRDRRLEVDLGRREPRARPPLARRASTRSRVGIGTALADDPLLTARDVERRPPADPRRLRLRTRGCRSTSRLVAHAPTRRRSIVIAGPDAPAADASTRSTTPASRSIVCPGEGPDRVRAALDELGRREITSLLLEGGPTLAGVLPRRGRDRRAAALRSRRSCSAAPRPRPLLGGAGAERIADAERALAVEWEPLGEDMLARARMREW